MVNENQISINIDTNSLTAAPANIDDCRQLLSNELQPILNKVFYDNAYKQKIYQKKDSINFACPFCRDSASSSTKKRAHLILSGRFAGYFKCFNCGTSMKFNKFFNEFDKVLPLNVVNGIKQIENSSNNQALSYGYQNTNLTSEVINSEECKQYAITRDTLKVLLQLQEISPISTPEAHKYLTNRCQTDMTKFLYNAEYKQIFILNMIDYSLILGIQMRDISGKAAVKYKTLTCSKIHKLVLQDNVNVPEQVEQLSMVFNIFNVNVYQPVIVTEGAFDAYLLPNCIATSGANKNFGVELPFWYLYDSDPTGNEHAIKMLRSGYKVFLWKKFKKDFGLPNKKKWDVTDVYCWLKSNNKYPKINWRLYFSESPLDGLNI
jgi:hypothetical protein